jgi:predicted acylesterase/phospholipase RssA
MPPDLSRRRLIGFAASGGVTVFLPGCTTPDRGPSVPVGDATQATVLGLPNERFFPLTGIAPLEAEFNAAVVRLHRTLRVATTAQMPELELLALSGGAENGAFGAGLLCGWTEHGGRPTFELVTGISAGALIAPFAYLGAEYDTQLRIFTQLTPDKVLTKRGFTAALFDDALTDNQPLFKTISSYMTEEIMAAIAVAYGQGRLLLVATTDLDAQQPVFWNIGAIAQSGDPRALDTIRRILLASAAMPGIFPPSMIDVTLNGKRYQEMHVDGGALAQTFLYPASLARQRQEKLARGEPVIRLQAYVIRNGQLDPQWTDVERRTLPIAERAISTMTTASGFNDVLRIYSNTQRDDIGFNLAYIDTDFTMKLPQPFDPGYMRALFDYGYQRGRAGYDWAHKPPFFS